MRCQKCGFISFDQQPSCAKCGVDQAAKPLDYNGTGQKIEPPFFLAVALGDAEAPEAPVVEVEEEVVEEVRQDGSSTLFDELEAESHGVVPEEEGELDLSFVGSEADADEEEISLDLPADDEISLEIPEEEEISLELPADDEISLEMPEEEEVALELPADEEISLEMPEEEEVSLELPADEEISLEMPEEEEVSLDLPADDEISLEMPEEEEISLELPADDEISLEMPEEEEEPKAEAPGEETLELSLEMSADEEEEGDGEDQGREDAEDQEADDNQGREDAEGLEASATGLDLEEIDLSDLISDSGAPSVQESFGGDENEEIFDLSSLMGESDNDSK